MYDDIFELLLDRLTPLASVQQDPKYHPEGDALFHSLQAFDLARDAREPPHLVAAALFHDLGKSSTEGRHEHTGAAFLSHVADDRTCFLVAHHMDLLRNAPATRRALHDEPELLDDLERLRDYDDRARRTEVYVTPMERALGWLLEPGVAELWLDELHHLEG